MAEEDRKSVGTEGTDVEVEEPFSPSATTKDKDSFGLELDNYMSASPVSHSPPEPISPSKEQALKEDISPVYDPHDPRKMKIAVGLSPSDFIREDKEEEEDDQEEEEEEEEEEETGPTIGLSPTGDATSPLEDQGGSPVTEAPEDQYPEDMIFEKPASVPEPIEMPAYIEEKHATVISAVEPEVTVETQTPLSSETEQAHPQVLEFMSFDNMAFAGKARIDWEGSSKEGSDPELDDDDDDDDEEEEEEEPSSPTIGDRVGLEGSVKLEDTKETAAEESIIGTIPVTEEDTIYTKEPSDLDDLVKDMEESQMYESAAYEFEVKQRSAQRTSISSEESGSERDVDTDMAYLQEQVRLTATLPPQEVEIASSDEEYAEELEFVRTEAAIMQEENELSDFKFEKLTFAETEIPVRHDEWDIKTGMTESEECLSEPEAGELTPKAGSPKRGSDVTEPHIPEPHESIEKAYEAQVIDTIMERCSHDFEFSDQMQMRPPGFQIGPIEYQEVEEEEGKQHAAAAAVTTLTTSSERFDVQPDHPSAARTASSESSSDTMTASVMTASYITAPASLEASEYHAADQSSMFDEALPSYEADAEFKMEDEEEEQEPEEVHLGELPKALEVISESRSQLLQEEKEKMARVTSGVSLDRTESASLDSEDLEESYGDQKDEMAEECQVDIMPSPQPPRVTEQIQEEYMHEDDEEEIEITEEERVDAPVVVAEAAARLIHHIEIGTPKPVESISSEELVKTSSSSDTSAEPTILAATYDLDSGAISRVVADYDISPDTVEKTLTVDSQPKAILSSPEDEVFESELGEHKGKKEARASEDDTDLTLVSLSPTYEGQTIPEEEEVQCVAAEARHLDDQEDRVGSPFEIVSGEDLLGYEDYMASSLEEKELTEGEVDSRDKAAAVGLGIAVGVGSVAGLAAFSGWSTATDGSLKPVSRGLSEEKKEEPAIRPSLSFGEQEESPTFEHSSPISSSEPSDFRGPISPFDTPAVEPLPDVVQAEDPIEEEPRAEEEPYDVVEQPEVDRYMHANGPTEVDYYPEHDMPFGQIQQLPAQPAEELEIAPVAPVAAVAPEPVLEEDIFQQIEDPMHFYPEEAARLEPEEEDPCILQSLQSEHIRAEPQEGEPAESHLFRDEPPAILEPLPVEPASEESYIFESSDSFEKVCPVEPSITIEEFPHETTDESFHDRADSPVSIAFRDVEPFDAADPAETYKGEFPEKEPITEVILLEKESERSDELAEDSIGEHMVDASASVSNIVDLDDSTTSESFSVVGHHQEDLLQESLTSSTELVTHAEDVDVPTVTVDTTTTTTSSFRTEHKHSVLTAESEHPGVTEVIDDKSDEPTGLTESLMEDLVPGGTDHMMESDQTLYNIEMPNYELSASQTRTEPRLPEVSSIEEELAEAARTISDDVLTISDDVPSDQAYQVLEEPRPLDRPPSSGKEALESDAMYTMFSGAVVTEVPPDYAQQAMEVDDDYYVSSTCYKSREELQEGAYRLEGESPILLEEPQLEDGGDSLMEDVDDELAALAEDTELDIPTGTDFSPLVLDSPAEQDASPDDAERSPIFELPQDLSDIERPQSPIPDDSQRFWDEEDTEERLMEVDKGDVSPIRYTCANEEEITEQLSASPEDAVLQTQASVFVHSVMTEAQATIQSRKPLDEAVSDEEVVEREEEYMSGSDETDYLEPVPQPQETAGKDDEYEVHRDYEAESSSVNKGESGDLPPPPSPPHTLVQFLPSSEEASEVPDECAPEPPHERAPEPPKEEISSEMSDDIPESTIPESSLIAHSIMSEVDTTVLSRELLDKEVSDEEVVKREEEDMSGSDDTDYLEPVPQPQEAAGEVAEYDVHRDYEVESLSSGETESEEDLLPPPPSPPHTLAQFLPSSEDVSEVPDECAPEPPHERAPEPPKEEMSSEMSDDIPEITITQHLHKETNEEDYPTSYAPDYQSPDDLDDDFNAIFCDSTEVEVDVQVDDDASPDTDSFLVKGLDAKTPKETKSGTPSTDSEEDLIESPEHEVQVMRVRKVEDIQQRLSEPALPAVKEESPSKEMLSEEGESDVEKGPDVSPEQAKEIAAAVVHGVFEAVKSDTDSFLGLGRTTQVSGLRTTGFEVSSEGSEFVDVEYEEQTLGEKAVDSDGEGQRREDETLEIPLDIDLVEIEAHKDDESGDKTPEDLPSSDQEPSSEMSSSGEGAASVISIDTAVRQREFVDLQSPEDLGDSSSVDSFATVVAMQQETTMEEIEDRLIEVASMTSSVHSDMQGSFHEDIPEAAIAIDVRDKELADVGKLSSSSSGEMFDLESAMMIAASPPEDDHYEVLNLMAELEYPRLPRQLESVKEEPESDQKDSSGETTSSSSERLGVGTAGSSSEHLYSSPDIPVPSPDMHGGRFFNKSNERDDISVSSSLLEFERLEMEVGDRTSLDSFKIEGRSVERDDISISSSLAEFENLEGVMGHSDSLEKVMVTPESKSSIDNASVCSLNEFEKLEQDFQTDSDNGKRSRLSSSSDSNHEFPVDNTSIKSSTSSLNEFERLEQEIYITTELQAEAQKVVCMLESGALVPEQRTESDMSLSEGASQREVSISQEQLVEPEDLPLDEPFSDDQLVPQRQEEDMDRDSLGDAEEVTDIERIIQEASRNVETFAPATEAVLVSRTLQEAIRTASCESTDTRTSLLDYGDSDTGAEADIDSLDGRDDEEFKQDEAAAAIIPTIIPSIVPAEQTTHEIDADSLQGDSESHSRSGALDSDSLQDQDSVMQISAESFELDPHGPTMSSSAEGDRMLRSTDSGGGVMDRSADSLELDRATAAPVMLRSGEGSTEYSGEGLMERSADSLEGDSVLPQSDSKDSFDCDSLHEDEGEVMGASAEWPGELEPPRPRRQINLMEMSMESGAWSQSSSLFSQDTMKSSASEAYKDIMRMSVDSPEYDKRTFIDITEKSSERYTHAEHVEEELEVRHVQCQEVEVQVTKSLIDSEGNVHTTQTVERKRIDDEGNVQFSSSQDQIEMMDIDTEWHQTATHDSGVCKVTSPSTAASQTVTGETVESDSCVSTPIAIPRTHQSPSARSSPSSESSHSETCYCGPDYTASMETGWRPDQPERPLATRGSTNPLLYLCCM